MTSPSSRPSNRMSSLNSSSEATGTAASVTDMRSVKSISLDRARRRRARGDAARAPPFRETGPMRVVFASAEVSPVATVGGLAFAVAGLAAELRRLGVDVEVVMPDYGGIALVDETSSSIAVPGWVGAATLRIGRHPSIGRLHL